MNRQELLRWIDELDETAPKSAVKRGGILAASMAWMVSAQSMLEAALPLGHPILRESMSSFYAREESIEHVRLQRLLGLVIATKELIENDRLDSMTDGVRAQTESELLDTAFELLSSGSLIAATVLAGGTLEVHLRRLYEKTSGLQPLKGDPTISKYDGAIAAGRNAGLPVPYDGVETKNIQAWASRRNEAAHTPDKFSATTDQVRLMLEGVRGFIARVK